MRQRAFIQALAGVALVGVAGSAQGAFTYFASFGGHDYYFNDVPNSFLGARAAANGLAASLGASQSYLYSINSAAEESLVTIAFRNTFAGGTQGPTFWIGLENSTPNNAAGWTTWDSGEAVTYTNWGGGGVVLDNPAAPYASANWNTVPVWVPLGPNGEPFGFKHSIVEVVPAPGAMALVGLGGLLMARRRR